MEAYKAVNSSLAIIIALAAMLSAFILPAEVPALLAAFSFPCLTYHIFNEAGDQGGDYGSVLTFVLLFLFWIVAVFAVIYWHYGLVPSSTGKDAQVSFLNAAYFSVTTWTTLGYGDLVPATDVGQSMAMFEAVLGQVFLVTVVALAVGNLGAQVRPRGDGAHARDGSDDRGGAPT